jgi:hypothetical protein
MPTRLCDLKCQVHRDNSSLDGPGRSNNVAAYYLRLSNYREGNNARDVRSYGRGSHRRRTQGRRDVPRMCGWNEPERVNVQSVAVRVDAALIEELRAGYAQLGTRRQQQLANPREPGM